MTKHWKTLKADIEHTIRTGEGYTKEIAEWTGDLVAKSLLRQLNRSQQRSTGLRVSNLGTPCERRLFYSTRGGFDPEPMPAYVLNKFIFGDIIEAHALGLAKASGHDVQGMQTKLDVCGVVGSRDAVIDGLLVDVKSAASNSFEKFKHNGLRSSDPFGYLSQLSSYLYGSRNDPLVRYKTKAAFLVMDKQFGHVAFDVYDLSEELDKKEWEVARKKAIVASDEVPPRPYEPVPHNKSGNMKLAPACSYCEYKKTCWENLRGFAYSAGPVWMTTVVEEPRGNVMEIK